MTGRAVRTNFAGLYRLQIPGGSQTAFFRSVGYRPLRLKVELRDHEAVYAAVVMIRQGAQDLDTVGLGVRMVPYSECGNMSCPKQSRAASATGGACWVSVAYDGQIIYRSGRGGEPPDFLKDFRPYELESIEYYRGSATIPLEFSGIGEQCGVLVLWSRRR